MSRPLLVATRSRGKQAEFRELLARLGRPIVFPDDVGLSYSAEEDQLETADSFEGNARIKAEWFATRSGLDTLADDSGLEVDALGGAPGVHSKRFAGVDGPDHEVTAANNAELLRRLAGVPTELRTARYRCVLVCLSPQMDDSDLAGQWADSTLRRLPDPVPYGSCSTFKQIEAAAFGSVGPLPSRFGVIAEGVTTGRILEAPEGSGGFGYDPLFWSDDLGMSFGQAPPEAKGAVSHRGRAVAALIGALTR